MNVVDVSRHQLYKLFLRSEDFRLRRRQLLHGTRKLRLGAQ